MDKCPLKRHTEEGQRKRGGESPVKTVAEDRVMQSQAKGCLEPAGAGRDRQDPPVEPLEGATAPLRLWTSALQDCVQINFCCFKISHGQSTVPAVRLIHVAHAQFLSGV